MRYALLVIGLCVLASACDRFSPSASVAMGNCRKEGLVEFPTDRSLQMDYALFCMQGQGFEYRFDHPACSVVGAADRVECYEFTNSPLHPRPYLPEPSPTRELLQPPTAPPPPPTPPNTTVLPRPL